MRVSQLIGHVCMSVGVFVLILENNIVIILNWIQNVVQAHCLQAVEENSTFKETLSVAYVCLWKPLCKEISWWPSLVFVCLSHYFSMQICSCSSWHLWKMKFSAASLWTFTPWAAHSSASIKSQWIKQITLCSIYELGQPPRCPPPPQCCKDLDLLKQKNPARQSWRDKELWH